MKNKVISILLSTTIVASSLIMGGCGSSESTASTATSVATDSTTTDSTAQDTSTDASATSESTAEAADETPVTITYYTWAQSNDGSYPQSMIDAFEKKYPWITVDFQMGPTDQEEYVQAQKIKLLAGDGIDVTTLFPSTYQDYIDAGYLQDISGSDYLNSYSDDAMKAVTISDKVYGIPYAEDVVGVVYNKDMFDENGWSVPTSREEWLSLCDEVAKTGVTPMTQGVKDTWPLAQEAMPFMQGVYANDSDIFSKISDGSAKYTDQVFVDAFTDMQDYFNSDAVSQDALGLTYDQAAAYFATGKAAMITHGEWIMGSIDAAEPDFNIGVFAVPTNKDGEKAMGAAEIGQYQAICASSTHQEAANLFMSYISSTEGAQYFADSMSNLTPVNGVSTTGKEDWTALLSNDSLPFYYDQMYTGASSELYKQVQLMYSGDTTVEDALTSIQTAQEKQD